MIDSDVLLSPDSGPKFVLAPKTAVLYSERVHSLTWKLADTPHYSKILFPLADCFVDTHRPTNRLKQYGDFWTRPGDVSLLVAEGVDLRLVHKNGADHQIALVSPVACSKSGLVTFLPGGLQ